MKKAILLIISLILSYSGYSQGSHLLQHNPLMKKGSNYFLASSLLVTNSDTTGKFISNYAKGTYSYDVTGRRAIDSFYYWDTSTNNLNNHAIEYYTYVFDGSGNTLSATIYEPNSNAGPFVMFQSDTFFYDANGNVISDYNTTININGVQRGRTLNTYNSKGDLLSQTMAGWSKTDNSYHDSQRKVFAYDSAGYLQYEFFDGTGGNNVWYLIGYHFIQYTSDHLGYFFLTNDSSKILLEFVELDNNNRTIADRLYEGTVKPQIYNLDKYTYDVNGYVLTFMDSNTPAKNRGQLYTYTYQSFAGVESETKDQSQFSIFPNPCQNTFTVDLKENNSKPTSIIIRNMQGQEVKSISVNTQSSSIIDISELPSGIYFVTILSNEKCSTQKLIKNF